MGFLSRVAHLFPPPRLLTLPSVGVDISESSMKYIQLRSHHSGRSLVGWGDIPIPPGVVVRGHIADSAKLAVVLAQVRARCGTPYVRLSLPEERAYLFETEIQRGMAEKDIRGALEFRMEENVPLSPRDALFDYDIVDDGAQHGTALHIGVAVYAKETIINYYNACVAAGLMPLSFEVEADAIARAATPADVDGVFMVLDLGRMRTGVGIVHKHTTLYTSTIDIGGQQFSDALQQQRGEVTDDAVLTALKNERGLLRTGAADDVYETLLPVVAALKDEIATRVSYWDARNADRDTRKISRIILCGGSVNMAGLPEYLTETLGIETERVDIWGNVFASHDFVPPITRRYSYGYATAVGLALRDTLEQETL